MVLFNRANLFVFERDFKLDSYCFLAHLGTAIVLLSGDPLFISKQWLVMALQAIKDMNNSFELDLKIFYVFFALRVVDVEADLNFLTGCESLFFQ